MQRDAVKFNGKPEELVLKYGTGKECSNGSYLYTLENDDRALFATPALNRDLQRLRPFPGMRVSIQMMANSQWDVRPVDPPAKASGPALVAPSHSQQAVAAVPSQNAQHGNGSTRQDTLTQLGNVLVHGNPEGLRPASPALMTGLGQFYLQQACLLVDIAATALRYSTEMYGSALGPEDVRAIVNTMYISHTPKAQGGR